MSRRSLASSILLRFRAFRSEQHPHGVSDFVAGVVVDGLIEGVDFFVFSDTFVFGGRSPLETTGVKVV